MIGEEQQDHREHQHPENLGTYRTHDGFPTDVADSLAMISAQDVAGYQLAVESVLDSFESRDEHLEDIPVADTVIVLQTLALQRDMAAELESQLLPSSRVR